MKRAFGIRVWMFFATLMLLLASDAAPAANGTPLWILEQNRRAAEQAERRPSAPIVSRPASTPTVAVPTPRSLDPD